MTQPQVRLPELPPELQRLIFAHMYATRIPYKHVPEA